MRVLAKRLLATALATATIHTAAGEYAAVTDERLRNPEADNWLMYRGTYDSHGYSPLAQINTDNVADLKPLWTFSTGMREGHQAPPVVNDGKMFITTPNNHLLALDAASGELLWRYRRDLPEDLSQMHPTNRGVGLYGQLVFMATADCYLVALDAVSGEVVWETEIEDYGAGYYMTLAPLVAEGKVMVGVSGGEYGIRGFVAAAGRQDRRIRLEDLYDSRAREPGSDSWPAIRGKPVACRCGLPVPTILHRTQLLGHRQRRPVDRRYPPRRQPLFHVGAGARRPHRRLARPPSIPLERFVGLGRSFGAALDRLRARRRDRRRPRASRAQRLLMVPEAPNWRRHRLRRRQTLREAGCVHPPSIRRPGGRPTTNRKNPALARARRSVRRIGAARIGRRPRFRRALVLLYVPANDNVCAYMSGLEEEYRAGRTFMGADMETFTLVLDDGRAIHRRTAGLARGYVRGSMERAVRGP